MAIFDELNSTHRVLQDREARQSMPIQRAPAAAPQKQKSTSVSLRRYKVSMFIVNTIMFVIAAAMISSVVYIAVAAFVE